VSSWQLTQNFLPASTQKLREPIPQNNSKTWTSPFPKQATQDHVSRAHTGTKMHSELSHFPSHGHRKVARHSTCEHKHASAQIQNYNRTNKKSMRDCAEQETSC